MNNNRFAINDTSLRAAATLTLTLLLAGCAGGQSEFACDATTTDNCMTMSAANQHAKAKAASVAGKQGAGALPALVDLPPAPQAPASSTQPVRVMPPHSVPPKGVPAHKAATVTPGATPSAPSVTGDAKVEGGYKPATDLASQITARLSPACAPHAPCPQTQPPRREQEQWVSLWLAPWVDEQDTLHQGGQVHFVVTAGQWQLPPVR